MTDKQKGEFNEDVDPLKGNLVNNGREATEKEVNDELKNILNDANL